MDNNLTDKIIDIFKSKFGWNVDYLDMNNDVNSSFGNGQLQLKTTHREVHLACEVKKSVVPSSIPALEQIVKDNALRVNTVQGSILLANYISTKAREMLVKMNINFADTGGNIYLKYKDIHVQIETGQSDRSALSKDNGRAFTKTGLKVIFQFFRTNQIVKLNDSYRKIAEEANVSKDTVAKVIIDLLEQGYIIRRSKTELKWKAKSELFEKWIQLYNQILRPNLASQKFKFKEKPQNDTCPPTGYQVSGYNAVENTNNIPPNKRIINPEYIYYTNLPIRDAVKNLQLIPKSNGNVTVIGAFWRDESKDHAAVDDIISYADLVNTNDPRNLDIAKIIYTKYAHDKF